MTTKEYKAIIAVVDLVQENTFSFEQLKEFIKSLTHFDSEDSTSGPFDQYGYYN